MSDLPNVKKTTFGRSFLCFPLELFSTGETGRAVLFSSSFGAAAPCAALLETFARALSELLSDPAASPGACAALRVRRVFLIPSPNPDALFIRSLAFTPDHPLYGRVAKFASPSGFPSYSANGRGVDLQRNFNFSFSACRASSAPGPSPAGYAGAYPESEPESSSFARLLRQLDPRLLVVLDAAAPADPAAPSASGGFSLPPQREEPWLRALCKRSAPFGESPADFAGSPEGWFSSERSGASLRLSIPPSVLDRGPDSAFALLRPLLFSLISF